MNGGFSWLNERAAGTSLHLSCLPGNQGIGVAGRQAHKFLDFLSKAGMRYWQLLPLGPTGFGDSPFQSYSGAALNPLFIDMEALPAAGLLQTKELAPLHALDPSVIDFARIYAIKMPLLRLAWRNFKKRGLSYLPNYGLLHVFVSQHESWLKPYSLFMAFKQNFRQAAWYDWPDRYGSFSRAAESGLTPQVLEEQEFHTWLQYLAAGQWLLLRRKAADCGVQLIGWLPHHPAMDSVEVWQNPEYYGIGADNTPAFWVGEAPSPRIPEGAVLHRPTIDWDVATRNGHSVWQAGIQRALNWHDALIIDNFRHFSQIWAVPGHSCDASDGHVQRTGGKELFAALAAADTLPRILARDVDLNSVANRMLASQLGVASLSLLQQGLSENDRDPRAPHLLPAHSALCTSDHDSPTATAWYESANHRVQDKVRRYFRVNGSDIAWDCIRCAYRSHSCLALVAFQDLLSLDNAARLNKPGVAGGNWSWRMQDHHWQALRGSESYLAELAWLYDR